LESDNVRRIMGAGSSHERPMMASARFDAAAVSTSRAPCVFTTCAASCYEHEYFDYERMLGQRDARDTRVLARDADA
jgi:hypothetical protein